MHTSLANLLLPPLSLSRHRCSCKSLPALKCSLISVYQLIGNQSLIDCRHLLSPSSPSPSHRPRSFSTSTCSRSIFSRQPLVTEGDPFSFSFLLLGSWAVVFTGKFSSSTFPHQESLQLFVIGSCCISALSPAGLAACFLCGLAAQRGIKASVLLGACR